MILIIKNYETFESDLSDYVGPFIEETGSFRGHVTGETDAGYGASFELRGGSWTLAYFDNALQAQKACRKIAALVAETLLTHALESPVVIVIDLEEALGATLADCAKKTMSR